jgi:hypothetical protein
MPMTIQPRGETDAGNSSPSICRVINASPSPSEASTTPAKAPPAPATPSSSAKPSPKEKKNRGREIPSTACYIGSLKDRHFDQPTGAASWARCQDFQEPV